jgi:Domain of unknown function (DUF4442)
MSARFIKKARGPIRAQTSLPQIDWSSPQELVGTVTLLNAANEVVMTASQQWKVGQINQEQSP